MLQIVKSDPSFFNQKIRQHKPKNWDETQPFRAELRKHIWEVEQNHQCAYTELYLKSSNREDSHIDHFRTQNLFPKDFDKYDNLFVAGKQEDFGAKYKDKNLSDRKQYDLLLSPLSANLNNQFKYDRNTGEILGENENAKAIETIRIFNLNHPLLVIRRLRLIETVSAYKDQNISFEDAIASTRGFENLIRYIYTVNNN